jgi:hypothetical protein
MKKMILTGMIAAISMGSFAQGPDCPFPNPPSNCQNGTSNDIILANTPFNCHQYVKAALLGNSWDPYVDLSNGNLIKSASSIDNDFTTGAIELDSRFVRVCTKAQARIVEMNHALNNADHSALILNGGMSSCQSGYFASTPGSGSNLTRHGNPRLGTDACSFQLYAVTPSAPISWTPMSLGGSTTLTVNVSNIPGYLHWEWILPLPSFMTLNSGTATSTSLNVTMNNFGSGQIGIKIWSDCGSSSISANGLGKRMVTVNFNPDCSGTINGSQLNTFNTVCPVANNVNMNYGLSWTWVKTQGNPSSWSIGGSPHGDQLNFSLSSGCVTFNGWNAYCNITRTFCKSSCFMSMMTELPPEYDYEVISLTKSGTVKRGKVESEDDTESMLEGIANRTICDQCQWPAEKSNVGEVGRQLQSGTKQGFACLVFVARLVFMFPVFRQYFFGATAAFIHNDFSAFKVAHCWEATTLVQIVSARKNRHKRQKSSDFNSL